MNMLQQQQQRVVRKSGGCGSGAAGARGVVCRGRRLRSRCRPVAHGAVVAGGKVYIDPVKEECVAFAPATVANLGPGFDWLGCAVEVSWMDLGVHGWMCFPC